MSGTPTPVHVVVKPFGEDSIPPQYITLPIPIPDQTPTDPGAASFDTGFAPLNMTDLAAGGIPPRGRDMNGLLYMLSAYCAMLQAGQRCEYDTDASAAFEGYKIGAELASSTTPGRVWVNFLDGNTNDPDADDTGWCAKDPLYATSSPPAGTINNLVLPGLSDYALDIDTTLGAVDITGLVAQRNGQKVFLSNTGANLLQVLANNAGSAVENRVRAATDLALVQQQTLTLQWFDTLDRWLLV